MPEIRILVLANKFAFIFTQLDAFLTHLWGKRCLACLARYRYLSFSNFYQRVEYLRTPEEHINID